MRVPSRICRQFWRFALVAGFAGAMAASAQATPCGSGNYPFPYTDVAAVGDAFCPGIMEAYVLGVTKGTTPTTFSPNQTVDRTQMTTFLQRSLDQGLRRSARHAALNQWWLPGGASGMQAIGVGGSPQHCTADGDAIWATNDGQVVKVEASTGKVLGTWTGATSSYDALSAAGRIFVTGNESPGKLYVIDTTQPAGAVTVAAANLGNNPTGIAFDGGRLWTANGSGSVSIITVQPTTPYNIVTTVSAGFVFPFGIVYDGARIWVTDFAAGTLLRLDATGAVVQTVTVGASPIAPVFDGANIWVPNQGSNSITVVQATTGAVVGTINADAANQLNGPVGASFDGQRILVTNFGGASVSVFKAADMSFIANVATSALPRFPCSDGINFWLPMLNAASVLRF